MLAWDPPRRLVFTWQIGPYRAPQPDPSKAGEVEVTFEPAANGATTVALEHRGFGHPGEGGDSYRDALASAEGWPHILGRYAAVVAETADDLPAPSEMEHTTRADDRFTARGGRRPAEAREPGHLSTDELVEMVERASRRVRE